MKSQNNITPLMVMLNELNEVQRNALKELLTLQLESSSTQTTEAKLRAEIDDLNEELTMLREAALQLNEANDQALRGSHVTDSRRDSLWVNLQHALGLPVGNAERRATGPFTAFPFHWGKLV